MSIYLFIDGTNLYAAQYELFGPEKYLNFPEFIKNIENKLKIKFDKIYFYASYSPQPKNPTPKEKLYLKNEALFYRSVKQTKNLTFFIGYRSKTSGKEKEVDVKLTVDIVDFAYKNYYQEIYLLSGDVDFLQALFCIKKLNKKIFVISLENKIMHRAPFHFLTFILKFTKRDIKNQFAKFQKYKIVSFYKDKLLEKIP
jgi:uncharacterized LabA/DUF88 family protein